MDRIIGYIGRQAIDSTNHIIHLAAFSFCIIKQFFKPSRAGRTVVHHIALEQIYYTGVQALPILIPTSLLIGGTLIIQFSKISGQYELGKTVVILVLRELGPMLIAFLVILRSATVVTIEISQMNSLNEIDAIEMAGLDPLRIICVPRIIGITVAVLGLYVVFAILSIIGGFFIIWAGTDIFLGNFLDQIGKAITPADMIVGIGKVLWFGITITITCLYHGLRKEKRITDIPVIASRAGIECFFYCLLINVLISTVYYL